MVLGMSLGTFTALHVLLSLIGIGSGVVLVWGLISGKPLNGLTAIFIVTTVLTSVTGFLFPVDHILPSHKVGLLADYIGGGNSCALCLQDGGWLAHSLRYWLCRSPLPECVCPRCSVFPESASSKSTSAHPTGATFPHRPTRVVIDLRGSYDFGREKVSCARSARRLISHTSPNLADQ